MREFSFSFCSLTLHSFMGLLISLLQLLDSSKLERRNMPTHTNILTRACARIYSVRYDTQSDAQLKLIKFSCSLFFIQSSEKIFETIYMKKCQVHRNTRHTLIHIQISAFSQTVDETSFSNCDYCIILHYDLCRIDKLTLLSGKDGK